MTYNWELIECKYLHNSPLSDSLPLVRVFWGCPVTPSNGGLRNTLLGVVDIQKPQTAALKHPIFNSERGEIACTYILTLASTKSVFSMRDP